MPISNLSNGLRTGVCTSTNRPTTPYEGQVIYETDTDKVFVWNGSAWVIPNAPAQNPQGLELVTTCTVTSVGGTAATASGGVVTIGTSNTSVTVSSAFSSTYDNYQIHLSGIKFNTTNGTLKCALGSTTTGYYQNGYYTNYASATINGNPANNTNPYFEVAFTEATNTNAQSVMFHLYAPNLADHTRMSSAWATESYTGVFNGILNNTTQYTAFTISTSGGTPTMTGGTIRVYGYRNS